MVKYKFQKYKNRCQVFQSVQVAKSLVVIVSRSISLQNHGGEPFTNLQEQGKGFKCKFERIGKAVVVFFDNIQVVIEGLVNFNKVLSSSLHYFDSRLSLCIQQVSVDVAQPSLFSFLVSTRLL